jgi:hypothetical protein
MSVAWSMHLTISWHLVLGVNLWDSESNILIYRERHFRVEVTCQVRGRRSCIWTLEVCVQSQAFNNRLSHLPLWDGILIWLWEEFPLPLNTLSGGALLSPGHGYYSSSYFCPNKTSQLFLWQKIMYQKQVGFSLEMKNVIEKSINLIHHIK